MPNDKPMISTYASPHLSRDRNGHSDGRNHSRSRERMHLPMLRENPSSAGIARAGSHPSSAADDSSRYGAAASRTTRHFPEQRPGRSAPYGSGVPPVTDPLTPSTVIREPPKRNRAPKHAEQAGMRGSASALHDLRRTGIGASRRRCSYLKFNRHWRHPS